MASGIYAITNTINGKVYVGSTIDFKRRWGDHRCALLCNNHSNPHLQRAWNKCGEDAFEFGVLEYLNNLDELVKAEQFWMDVYREEGRVLYNCGLAADCPARGRVQTEEHRRKNSEANMGENNHFYGKHHTEESKCKIGEASKGRKFTEEAKYNMGTASRGKKFSKEHRRNLSESLTGRIFSEEHRHNLSESKKGKPSGMSGKKHSKESIQKMSEAHKGKKLSDEHKRNIGKSLVGRASGMLGKKTY